MVAVTLLWSACAHQKTARHVYVGTVTRIEEPNGAYYSTALGPTSFTRIVVRLTSSYSTASYVLTVALNDVYLPEVYGRIGDRVTFRSLVALPLNREVPFRSVVDYRVRRQRPVVTTE